MNIINSIKNLFPKKKKYIIYADMISEMIIKSNRIIIVVEARSDSQALRKARRSVRKSGLRISSVVKDRNVLKTR